MISNIYIPRELSPTLVNTSVRKLLKGEQCAFFVGDQLYDFIYIVDATSGEKGRANKTYYIGSLGIKPLRDCIDPIIELGLGESLINGVCLAYKEIDINAVKIILVMCRRCLLEME